MKHIKIWTGKNLLKVAERSQENSSMEYRYLYIDNQTYFKRLDIASGTVPVQGLATVCILLTHL